jgi:predicted GNAT family N-acyltransferase
MQDILVQITSFRESEPAIRAVRDAVFGDEQGIPRELDWDGNDPECVQALAFASGDPVGTGRLQPDGRIGRIAVLRDSRRRGIGGLILNCLADAARTRGLVRAYLHAQVASVPFYRGHGFVPEGDAFLEAGIPHVTMKRDL